MNNQTSMSLEQDNLSLKWAFVSIAVVSAIILVLVGIFALMDKVRQEQVVTQYTKVVDNFVTVNNGKVESLFDTTFDQCHSDLNLANLANSKAGNNYTNNTFDCPTAQQAFNQLNKNALSDFPSTAFLRVKDEQIELIEASGAYFHFNNLNEAYLLGNKRDDLRLYLFQNGQIRRWNTFLSYMGQRQVIAPIMQNQQIIGYMFVGVIEK